MCRFAARTFPKKAVPQELEESLPELPLVDDLSVFNWFDAIEDYGSETAEPEKLQDAFGVCGNHDSGAATSQYRLDNGYPVTTCDAPTGLDIDFMDLFKEDAEVMGAQAVKALCSPQLEIKAEIPPGVQSRSSSMTSAVAEMPQFAVPNTAQSQVQQAILPQAVQPVSVTAPPAVPAPVPTVLNEMVANQAAAVAAALLPSVQQAQVLQNLAGLQNIQNLAGLQNLPALQNLHSIAAAQQWLAMQQKSQQQPCDGVESVERIKKKRRESAQRSRARKNQYMKALELENNKLKEENAKLRSILGKFEKDFCSAAVKVAPVMAVGEMTA